MPNYQVQSKTRRGKTVSEVRFAASRQQLIADLRQSDLIPVKIRETSQDARAAQASARRGRGVPVEELAMAIRTFAVLMEAGIRIVESLEEVAMQVKSPHLKRALLDVAESTRDGTSLTQALAQQDHVFPRLMVSMAEIGEESGNLPRIMSELADYLDSQAEIKQRIKTGTRYPMFIAVIFVAVLGIIFFWILPKFKTIFSQFGADLPIQTRILLGISDFVSEHIIWILAALAVIWFILKLVFRVEAVLRFKDGLILRLPVLGNIAVKLIMTRVARTLCLLLGSGISIIRALELVARVSDNRLIRDDITAVMNRVVQGHALADEFANHPRFPNLFTRLVAAGEESGELEELLARLADQYYREASSAIDGALSLLEPAFIVLLGIVVGTVIMGVYLPIFKLSEAV